MTDVKSHWQDIYRTKRPEAVSWYAQHLDVSLELIDTLKLGKQQSIIDVGGGASTLVDDLLARGYTDLTVLDISADALQASMRRLGAEAAKVKWMAADLLQSDFADRRFDLWHDRAVFHFLTDEQDRARYREQMLAHLSANGFVILGTFADDGPTKCSGLDVRRHSESDIDVFLGPAFRRVAARRSTHVTPGGAQQRFVSVAAQRTGTTNNA